MGVRIDKMETTYSRIAAMGDPFLKSTQVAVLVSPFSNLLKYEVITASTNTKKKDEASWNHVMMNFIQEQERHKSQKNHPNMEQDVRIPLATLYDRSEGKKKKKGNIDGHTSENDGHIARQCRFLPKNNTERNENSLELKRGERLETMN